MKKKFNWLSSSDSINRKTLVEFQSKMQDFYASSELYYSDIDYNNDIWKHYENYAQRDILNEADCHQKILEVGCGKANILRADEKMAPKYCGLDFSETLIKENRLRYPDSRFYLIKDPQIFPLDDQGFDLVFSHFVIEHVVFPMYFLKESMRVLKPGGTFIILCPDFTGRYRITSQRVGLGPGTGREKLQNGAFVNALLTLFDSRIRMPLLVNYWKHQSKRNPKFIINTQPVCYTDKFKPDVDAIYVTNKEEIKLYLAEQITWSQVPLNIEHQNKSKRLIYIKGVKK